MHQGIRLICLDHRALVGKLIGADAAGKMHRFKEQRQALGEEILRSRERRGHAQGRGTEREASQPRALHFLALERITERDQTAQAVAEKEKRAVSLDQPLPLQ